MKINIKATNITLTPEITDYLQKKMDMLQKFIDGESDAAVCNVEIGKINNHHRSGEVFKAEINLRKEGKDFRAAAEEETLYAAIDEVKDEIVRELTSFKSKRTTLVRRGGAAIKNIIKGIGGGVGKIRGFRFKRNK